MAVSPQAKIFSNQDRTEFAGRETELASLLAYADEWKDDGGLFLYAEPGSGASELLRQTADTLHSRSDKVIPFYFKLSETDTDSIETARRFAYEFVLQAVAFLRGKPSLLSVAPSIDELKAISTPRDSAWIDDLHRAIREFGKDDFGSLARICLSAPFRAAAAGTESVVVIDEFHLAANIAGGFSEDLHAVFERASVPYIFAGHRRGISPRTTAKRFDLTRPSFLWAGPIIASIAARRGVEINDECRDLIATQCGCDLSLIDSLLATAADSRIDLDSFLKTEQVYAESLFGGHVGRRFDAVFNSVSDSKEAQRRIIGLIADSAPSDEGGIPIELWERRIDAKPKRIRQMIDRLYVSELIDVDSQSVQLNAKDIVLEDYLDKRTKLEFEGANRAIVFGKSLGEYIKRAPRLMADIYRREASLGLRGLLASFEGTELPLGLIDYGVFNEELKGEADDVILEKLAKATAFVRLPRVYFASDTESFHHSFAEIAKTGMSAVAMGFDQSGADLEQTVWIAAQIESKLETSNDVTEYWCDHLEAVALKCDVAKYRIWLISPEGFTPESLELLKRRNSFGSSHKQIDLLRSFLRTEQDNVPAAVMDEYEFVLPMDQDAELIAARAIEDIAKRHSVAPKAVNQIKTALVEAYINASEHSLSPDRKIYQKIRIDEDKIEITISNRGIRLGDKNGKVVEFEQGRRGWGLKLMRQLMDEVRVETVDDGTRISMIKYLKRDVQAIAIK